MLSLNTLRKPWINLIIFMEIPSLFLMLTRLPSWMVVELLLEFVAQMKNVAGLQMNWALIMQ